MLHDGGIEGLSGNRLPSSRTTAGSGELGRLFSARAGPPGIDTTAQANNKTNFSHRARSCCALDIVLYSLRCTAFQASGRLRNTVFQPPDAHLKKVDVQQ